MFKFQKVFDAVLKYSILNTQYSFINTLLNIES
jgi:hypothetical protein